VAALRYEQRNRRGQRRRSLQVLIGLKIAERRRQLFPSQVPDSFETAAVAAAQRSRLAEEFFARISNEVRFAERAGGYPLGAISQITEGTPMHTQTKVLATALLAGFAALPTLAMAQAKGGNADLGFYAGASVGQSKTSDCPGGGSCDDKDTAYRVFGGYKFHPNIAVEGGYSPLGETSSSFAGGSLKAEANAWDIVGVGSWPLGNNFSILGKLGFYNAELKASGLVSGKKKIGRA